jgi:hypothetical protein
MPSVTGFRMVNSTPFFFAPEIASPESVTLWPWMSEITPNRALLPGGLSLVALTAAARIVLGPRLFDHKLPRGNPRLGTALNYLDHHNS